MSDSKQPIDPPDNTGTSSATGTEDLDEVELIDPPDNTVPKPIDPPDNT